MRVIVCGGRNFNDEAFLNETLSSLGVTFVIEGGAEGADTLAWKWARLNCKQPSMRFEADWRKHGLGAGPIRNQRMIDEGKPEAVVAFKGGRGTVDMVQRAKRAGLPVYDFRGAP